MTEWINNKTPDGIDQSISLNYFFSGLFDFSFKHMITPGLIRAQYAVLLVLFTIGELIGFFVLLKKSFWAAIGSLLLYFMFILMGRLWSEVMMVAFKIEVNTRSS